MALISIIVPIYNVEQYLSSCLESLVTQSFNDIEMICINDGSTDSSFEILKKFSRIDKRIKVINQKNQGVAETRNTGLDAATAPYIMFCDPDDEYLPQMCEKMKNAIYKSEADIACCEPKIIYHVDQSLRKSDYNYYKLKFKGFHTNILSIYNSIDVSLWNKIFKKSIIDRYNIRFLSGKIYEDANFFYKYLFISKNCYFMNEQLYIYNRRKNSIMNNTFKKSIRSLDHIFIIDDIYEFLKQNNLINRYKNQFLKLYRSYFYATKKWLPFRYYPYLFFLNRKLLKKYYCEFGLSFSIEK